MQRLVYRLFLVAVCMVQVPLPASIPDHHTSEQHTPKHSTFSCVLKKYTDSRC